MRKVTREAVAAFYAGNPYRNKNTTVEVDKACGLVKFKLHGNTIAERFTNEPLYRVYISDAGWQTVTTKERLNGLLGEIRCGHVYQKDFTWYLVLSDGEHVMEPGDWFAIDNGKLALCAA